MALDGIVLNQITKGLQSIVPGKINKIQQVSDTEILFTIRANNYNHKLMISAHSTYNRIHLTNRTYNTPEVPQNFIMVLRKHISGAIIKSMEQNGLDRILKFTLEARNELGDIHTMYMYVELMGKYANLILVNEENKVVDALKRIPPFENNTRTIHPGATFVSVPAQIGKKDPYVDATYDFDTSFTKQFYGFSPLLSEEVTHRLKNGQTWEEIMAEMANSSTLYVYEKDGKEYFHILPLTHLECACKQFDLQDGMDQIYYEKEEKVRIKEQSGDLFKVVRQELKKSRNKLVKLEKTLDEAYDLEQYRIYGDLLYAYAYKFPYKQKQVTLPDFETGEDVVIALDEKFDVKQNAKKYYQKYTKSKTAQVEIAKQIDLTLDSIEYFETLEAQLEQANFADAEEIREELSEKGYMRKKQQRIRARKKKKPSFITLAFEDCTMYVGKNNIQNDYITWKQSRKDHTWFHAKDLHGSHVVVDKKDLSEEEIRTAALLASYFSQGRNSSSVPVNYCLISQLRKPNKAALGFVTLTNYKTIYIDPSEEAIEQLLKQYSK